MNKFELIEKAKELVASVDLGQRHAIVIEHNDKVTALAAAALLAGQHSQLDNIKLICETLFALGYMEGQADQVQPKIFMEQFDDH